MTIIIDDIHNGMNLRDDPLYAEKGDTGIAVGCDFSVKGQVRPMREGLQVLEYTTDIVCAQSVYIGSTKYYFTTHITGLYVRSTSPTATLIDSNFFGNFKALVINNEYVVFMNSSYCRKWKPGWTTTYQWGLNTPPAPTVAAGTTASKTIDEFGSLGSWTTTGGGSGAALAADTTDFLSGTQSMKLTCDAGYTLKAGVAKATNLSYVTTAGDATDKSYITLAYYTANLTNVQSIRIMLSCESGAGFTKDFYEYRIVLGGYVYATLAMGKGESTPIVDSDTTSYKLNRSGGVVREEYDPVKKVIRTYTQGTDTTAPVYWDSELGYTFGPSVTGIDYGGEVVSDKPITIKQYQVSADERRIYTASGSWTYLKIPKADFIRQGATTGRDWATITAVRIELEAIGGQAIVSFDDWYLKGTGNLWGYYRVAVAYQNDLGNYGPYSEFSDEVQLTAQALSISGLTADTDGQTTARRIAVLGGSIAQPMVCVLENNTATTLTLNEPESSLQEIEAYFNNKPPQPGADMVQAFGRVFIVAPSGYDNRISYSEAGYYEAFPLKNYKLAQEGEQLKQVAVLNDNVVARGHDREYALQFLGSGHTTWRLVHGAREGAATSRMFLDLGKAHVYAAPKMFYMSGPGAEGEYLPKIGNIVSSFAGAIGASAGEKAYVYFQDTDGNHRVMRIDYRLGKPLAHYVADFQPTSIFADTIESEVYYSYGASIYKFDAGTGPLPTSLTILHQYGGNRKQKTFGPLMSYELDNGPLSMTFRIDRVAVTGTYSLPTAITPAEPVSLPQMLGRGIEITLSSTSEDYTLHLPIEIESEPIGI